MLKKREEFFIHRAESVKKNKESDTKSDLQHEKDKRSAKERKRRMGRTEETREKDNDATLAREEDKRGEAKKPRRQRAMREMLPEQPQQPTDRND